MNHAIYTARILIVALIAPLVIAAAGLIVGFSLAAHLPARIAVHWDLAGHANGYGSPYELPIAFAAVCLPIIAVFGGAVVLLSHRGPLTMLAKVLAISSTWITVLIGISFIGVLVDHKAARGAGLLFVAALVIATVVAAGAWFALPPGARGVVGKPRAATAPVALAEGERASWIRTTSASAGLIWTVIAICVALTAVTTVATISTQGRYWALAFIPLIVLLLVLSNFAWTVRVDARGVRIRSVLGIPVINVPLDRITSANAVDVQALAQYGGWGIRWALNGRIGIIVRSGEALEIHRTKGLGIVVTVDDASTAAALINGLLQRKRVPLP